MAAKPHYASYLHLKPILNAQHPLTEDPAHRHDEQFFIIVHQTSELWFKQLLSELGRINTLLGADDPNYSQLQAGFDRMLSIMQILIQQIFALYTLDSQAFFQFRSQLAPASGFQSEQFRVLELGLGVYDATPSVWEEQLTSMNASEHARLDTASRTSLQKNIVRLLSGMEAAEVVQQFWKTYLTQLDLSTMAPCAGLSEMKALLDHSTDTFFELDLNAVKVVLYLYHHPHAALATGALPLIQSCFSLEETLTRWRHQHAIMAERLIGYKKGTGGSSGAEYLKRTVQQRRFFTGLRALKTFMV